MSWQPSSLQKYGKWRSATSLLSFRGAARLLPSSVRGVNSTRPFRAVLGGDDIGTNARYHKQKTDHDQHVPINALAKSPSSAAHVNWTSARCVQLLAMDCQEPGQARTSSFLNQRVCVNGTIKSIRKQKHGAFAHVTDGSCYEAIQVVFKPELAAPLNHDTNLKVMGVWKASPARGQAYELVAEQIIIFGTTDLENYPIQKKYQTPEFLRKIPHLRLRTPLNLVLARFRSDCLLALQQYLSTSDYAGGYFVQVQPPIITSSDCEGAGEVFTLQPNAEVLTRAHNQDHEGSSQLASFFKSRKYLTVSSQLHLEAYSSALQNVWALSPTFRAEKSDTPRHLAEFYMLEMELGYVTSLHTLTGLVEHLIRSLVNNERVQRQRLELLLALRASQGVDSTHKAEEVEKRWNALSGEPWMHSTYAYCMDRLCQVAAANPSLFDHQPQHGSSLHLEHERWIVDKIGGNRPIFVTDYPKATKPFYMAPSVLAEEDNSHIQDNTMTITTTATDTVACFDLLMPFGASEIVGGSLREHRLEHLIQNMRQHGMLAQPQKPKPKPASTTLTPPTHHHDHHHHENKEPPNSNPHPDDDPLLLLLRPHESLGPLRWYVDLRRHATSPHGGFGIGWDRLLAYLSGVDNLRDVVPFPRSYGRANC